MIFSMNAQDLLEGLNTVTRALSARPAKQILEGVLISADDGRVQLTCSDGSLVIEYTNAADIQEEGQAKRKAAEAELSMLEADLKAKLLAASQGTLLDKKEEPALEPEVKVEDPFDLKKEADPVEMNGEEVSPSDNPFETPGE